MTQQRPTKKQREMLTFIENFIAGHGYGPSYREIKSGMGYSSVATVAKHVDNLITRGHLRKKDHSARSLEVVGQQEQKEVPVRGEAPSESEEKWLVKKIDEKFDFIAGKEDATQDDIDELYVLVGALKVLGFEGASKSFVTKLSELKDKLN